MKRLTIFFLVLLKLNSGCCQGKTSLFLNSNSKYYQSTNFSKSDSLEAWFYVLLDKNLSYEDAIKPIGQLIFQRETMINHWTPNFTFQIFNIKDSSYCFKKSQLVRNLSSCVPPNVAGDIIIFKQYILLNTNVCLQCKNFKDGLDYCRPLINKVFSAVDKTKVTSLEELVRQFPIKGQTMKLPF
jgi:hypothetical protein